MHKPDERKVTPQCTERAFAEAHQNAARVRPTAKQRRAAAAECVVAPCVAPEPGLSGLLPLALLVAGAVLLMVVLTA